MNELYIDEPEKWKTRELRQIHTYSSSNRQEQKVTPVHYISVYVVHRHDFLSIATASAVCSYLAQFPRLLLCAHIYIQLLHLWYLIVVFPESWCELVYFCSWQYEELMSKGNFAREDAVTMLTAHEGNVDAAFQV